MDLSNRIKLHLPSEDPEPEAPKYGVIRLLPASEQPTVEPTPADAYKTVRTVLSMSMGYGFDCLISEFEGEIPEGSRVQENHLHISPSDITRWQQRDERHFVATMPVTDVEGKISMREVLLGILHPYEIMNNHPAYFLNVDDIQLQSAGTDFHGRRYNPELSDFAERLFISAEPQEKFKYLHKP